MNGMKAIDLESRIPLVGHITLRQTPSNLPVYFMSVFQMSSKVVDQLEKKLRWEGFSLVML